jgi:hypothetical protein
MYSLQIFFGPYIFAKKRKEKCKKISSSSSSSPISFPLYQPRSTAVASSNCRRPSSPPYEFVVPHYPAVGTAPPGVLLYSTSVASPSAVGHTAITTSPTVVPRYKVDSLEPRPKNLNPRNPNLKCHRLDRRPPQPTPCSSDVGVTSFHATT